MTQANSLDIIERQRVEYDRFGPWTYPVHNTSEMPPRFDPWCEELKVCELVLKFPRPFERRDLLPTDDLYRAILAVGKGKIVYLSLNKEKVDRRLIELKDVAAVRLAQDLLLGELFIDLADGHSLVVSFNAVSAPLMEDFVDIVRKRPMASTRSFAPTLAPATATGVEGSTQEDILFVNLLRALNEKNPGLSVLAYQKPFPLKAKSAKGSRGIARLVASLFRWQLEGCLVAVTPSEIIALYRGRGGPKTGKIKGFRYELLYLSAASFEEARVESRVLPNGAEASALTLKALGHKYDLYFYEAPRLPKLAG